MLESFLPHLQRCRCCFHRFRNSPTVLESTLAGIERFVCNLYLPNTQFTQVKDVRWWLFKKKQAQSEGLPPTQSALLEGIKRAHYQALVWGSDTIPNPVIPSPQGYEWELEDSEWSPVMSQLLPAPEAIIHLIKCGCAKSRCSTNHCQCKKAGLNCTDLCNVPNQTMLARIPRLPQKVKMKRMM